VAGGSNPAKETIQPGKKGGGASPRWNGGSELNDESRRFTKKRTTVKNVTARERLRKEGIKVAPLGEMGGKRQSFSAKKKNFINPPKRYLTSTHTKEHGKTHCRGEGPILIVNNVERKRKRDDFRLNSTLDKGPREESKSIPH